MGLTDRVNFLMRTDTYGQVSRYSKLYGMSNAQLFRLFVYDGLNRINKDIAYRNFLAQMGKDTVRMLDNTFTVDSNIPQAELDALNYFLELEFNEEEKNGPSAIEYAEKVGILSSDQWGEIFDKIKAYAKGAV